MCRGLGLNQRRMEISPEFSRKFYLGNFSADLGYSSEAAHLRFFRNSRLSFWQTYSKPTSSNALTSSGFSSTLTVNSSSPLVTTAKAGNSYQVMFASECFAGYHPPLLIFSEQATSVYTRAHVASRPSGASE